MIDARIKANCMVVTWCGMLEADVSQRDLAVLQELVTTEILLAESRALIRAAELVERDCEQDVQTIVPSLRPPKEEYFAWKSAQRLRGMVHGGTTRGT